MRPLFCFFLFFALLPSAVVAGSVPISTVEWRENRLNSLRADYGWLSLIGLHWLVQGESRLGSAADNDIIFAAGPAHIGRIIYTPDSLEFFAEPGIEVSVHGMPQKQVVMTHDGAGEATQLKVGGLLFYAIKRGELAIRVKDPQAPARLNFSGVDFFDFDSSWVVDADWIPYKPPKMVPIVNVMGRSESSQVPGRIEFEREGKRHSLDAIGEPGMEELFIIFADKTSGRETYGVGRFLYTPLPRDDGHIKVDFNQAHNPPCAFNDFSTCPLPPAQNRLRLRVTAGEKDYEGHF